MRGHAQDVQGAVADLEYEEDVDPPQRQRAVDAGGIRWRQFLRMPADVAYPTDSGLLARAVRRIAATGRRIQAAGGATRTRLRDRSRAAGARARQIAAKLRLRAAQGRDEAQATVRRVTGELAELADRAATDAEKLLLNARRALRRADRSASRRQALGRPNPAAGRRRGRLRRAVTDLTELLAATRRIAAQTRQRLSGTTPDGATRRVSLHDGDARPIAKGRLGRPVEFGYKAQVLERGNPADAPQLVPAVGRVIARTGRRPRTVTADRGYGEAAVEDQLHDLGVRTVVIPRKGRPGKARQTHEHRRAFRRTVKWRTGSEARISTLKRQYGWDRTRLDDLDGARIWTGHGILAHNLVKIAALAA
jgi:IS5 family transposase